jgi:hypothetical protein
MNSNVPSSSSLEVTKNGDWKTMHTRVIATDHALCYSTVSWHFWVVDLVMCLRTILRCLLAGGIR